jgi:phospholipase C
VLTIPYIADAAASASNVNVATFDDSDWGGDRPKQLGAVPSTFAEDVANETLPPFSFIEPRYSRSFASNKLPPNSNHPGPGNYGLFTHSDPSDPPIDAAGGELLLMQVYNLLRQSSYWDSTLLIITYDEHGGLYDHVPPPTATPPGTVPLAASWTDPAAHGFGYTVYGGRVPAIVVSPYIPAGATLSSDPPFDHASIVKTVWETFGLSQNGVTSLTQRDGSAPSVTSSLCATASNNPPTFSGTIVANPMSLVFIGGVTAQALLFSAGPGLALGTTAADAWLRLSDPQLQTGVITVTVSVDTSNLASGTYTSSITISGTGVESVVVPVTLYVS